MIFQISVLQVPGHLLVSGKESTVADQNGEPLNNVQMLVTHWQKQSDVPTAFELGHTWGE